MDPAPFSGETILVTGATGFIGSHLCRRLGDGGAEVHGVSRAEQPREESGPRWWQGDLADLSTVRDLMAAIRPTVVFHLASHVAGARDAGLVVPTFRSNLTSTVNVLAVATEVRCRRVVLASSMEEPEPGNADAIPSSPYAVAKWAGSAYGRMFHALFQLPIVILRIFMVYGPRQRDVSKLVPYVTLALLRGESPKLTAGRRLVDWIYVDDVVDALLAAARSTGVEGCTIDVGSGELVPIRTVVEHLVRLIDRRIEPLFGALTERPLEQTRVADVTRSTALMGWKPGTALEDGLRHTVEWYRRHISGGVP
jgi:nucleoside-diphosphate-sugar epimerase